MFYRKKDLLEEAATVKRFEKLLKSSHLKKQSSISKKKQYQMLGKVYEFDKTEENETIN